MSLHFVTQKKTLFTEISLVTIALALGVFLALLPVVVALAALVFFICMKWMTGDAYFTRGVTYAFWMLALLAGLVIALYRPSAFHYPLIFQVDQLHTGGQSYALYANMGKLVGGWLCVWCLFRTPQGKIYIKSPGWQSVLAVFAAIFVVVTAAVLLNLEWFSKPLNLVVWFGVVNLLVTCVAEESFLRLLLQNPLSKAFRKLFKNESLSDVAALLLCAAFFWATHGAIVGDAGLVYGLAGLVYGLVYMLTKNMVYSVLTHFLTNILHFTFLTYPL